MYSFPPLGILRRSICRAVRRSVYIVQTTPDCPVNRDEYKVMGLLQSFMIYNYFRVEPIWG
jgi:hypothetical protein